MGQCVCVCVRLGSGEEGGGCYMGQSMAAFLGCWEGLLLGVHVQQQVCHAVAVAKLIVVPGDRAMRKGRMTDESSIMV